MFSEKTEHDFLDFAKSAKWDEAKQLIEEDPGLVNAQPKKRWSALHYASAQGRLDIVSFLLENSADVNATNRDGKTSVEVAGEMGKGKGKSTIDAVKRRLQGSEGQAFNGKGRSRSPHRQQGGKGMCKFFLAGCCRRGGSCAYSHGDGQDSSAVGQRGGQARSAQRKQEMYQLPNYVIAPSVEQAREDIQRAAKEGNVQQQYEAQQFCRYQEAIQRGEARGSCLTLHHGPGAPGTCKTGKHSWHFWLCHHCSTVQYWAACVNRCDWGTYGWTCIEPKCEGAACGCKKGKTYWKNNGRNWLVKKAT
jgi:hypothetical protein